MKQLPQPFKIETIQNHPKAVVISLLIGLLIMTCSTIGFLFTRGDSTQKLCETEKQLLVNQIINERNDRIKLYESLIFYKKESEVLKDELEASDSIIRGKTEPIVKKILQ